ncbi:Pimeloyl-ACP methyl ester carboxylesterase [Jatrophihabitans endophyticus]|uniref:Pimeloyl-ACP methyl ester carboxylesterase n=1 Tax=Jatrophihabitans endophyticus TaxID=1206085 RepID=A0A1M5EW10_9ACTN|nr:alpha/beta hydrolase [Jatrophihabitans endophyticus]SHF83281.1 Pimeloyl-ACP methyl ester carboxylesterase [Jatrophihabitans endophyticus]
MATQLDAGQAVRGELVADGARLATLCSGDTTAPPVLLVPGYTGSKEDFAPLLDPLADAGLRAVAIDLPGQFESPGLPPGSAYGVADLAAVVRAAGAALGPRVRLLGHSFGGLVCRAATIAAPQQVESLVLLSSGPAELGGARRALIELLEPVLAEGGLPGVYAALQSVSAVEPGTPPELLTFLERRFVTGDPAMLSGMGSALRAEPDRVAELAATGVPVLVVHGADDDAWPPAAQQDMARRLGARYEVVPGAAHSAAVENPTALLRHLTDFWR